MTPTLGTRLLIMGIVIAGLACGDSTAPIESAAWEWRLEIPFDSAGPRIDTLNFHWPRSRLPVRIWAEDTFSLGARAQEGITAWHGVLKSDWSGVVVTDSTQADVIVRLLPTNPFVAVRQRPPTLVCEGSTDVDTTTTRFQLQLPFRVQVYPISPTDPTLDACFRTVVAHELGHTLGLFQHSPDPADLMYTTPTAAGPTSRDAATVRQAYAQPSDLTIIGP